MIRTLASLALLAAACLPALADDSEDAADMNDIFVQGLASGATPQTVNEKWTCAVFWNVWTEFAEKDLGAEFVALLDPELGTGPARAASAHWEREAVLAMGMGMGELDAETELYLEQQTESAWDLAEGVVWGDDYTYLFILGECAAPPAQ